MYRKKTSGLAALLLCLTVVLTSCGASAGTAATSSTDASADPASASATTEASSATATEKPLMNELGIFPLVNQPVTITVFTGWGTKTDLNQNWNTIDYEKKTGVHVDWKLVTSGDAREKRALMIASGDLPELFLNGYNWFTAADEMQYGSQGSIIPLNKLIDSNSIYFKKILDENPLYRKIIASTDGNIYSLPTFAECFHCNYSQKMWINVDWLSKLGLKMPTTTDEYYQVLKAFKEQDPNGNGKADEMPLASTTDGWHYQLDGFLMNAFTYSDADTHLELNNGKIEMSATKDSYREGLRFLNKLYAEKLITPQSFTMNASSMSKLNEGGDKTVVGSVPGGANYIFASGQAVSSRWKEYDIMPPLKGPNGFVSAPNYSATRNVITGDTAISKNAKNPELLMRWVDWLYSDEGTLWHDTNGGREGQEYRKAEAGEKGLGGDPALFTSLKVANGDNNVVWEQFAPGNMSKKFREGWTVDQDWHVDSPMAQEVQLFQGSKAYEAVAPAADQSLPNLFVSPDKISDYTRIKTGVDDYIKESVTKFIIGDLSLDKDWDSYVSKLDAIGLQDYLKMCQESYDIKFKN